MSIKSDNDTTKVIDFPKDESVQTQAARWLAALDVDHPSEETLAAFKLWINANEVHRREFESAAAFWGDLNILTQVSPPRTNLTANKSSRMTWRPIFASVAVIFLAVFSVIFFQGFNEPRIMSYMTAIGEQKTIKLPDQSVVYLNTNSHIVVNYSSTLRGIRLERGEALFEVAHDKAKPFEVSAGDRIVRAVGTAFSVHFQKDNHVEVLVAEGVVEIDKPVSPSKPIVSNTALQANPNVIKKVRVKAGSQASFGNKVEGTVLVAEMQQIEDKLTWRTGVLVFDREPLESVVNEIGRYTTTKFIVPDKDVREMIVGGVFKVGDNESLFEALQLGFGIQALEVSDNVIQLSKIDVRSQ